MNIKTIISLSLISTLSFTGCMTPNIPSTTNKNNKTQEGGEGTQLMSTLGGALMGVLSVYVGNKIKNIDKKETQEEKEIREEKEKKQMLGGFLIGGAAGYFIGGKLADMQKRYKGEEEVLISKILKIDKLSDDLKNKNKNLLYELNELENKFTNLKSMKHEQNSNKLKLKRQLISKLTIKKQNIKDLLHKYEGLSTQIYNSRLRVNQYEYKKQDKKEILEYIEKLSNNSQQQKNELHTKIALINSNLEEIG